MLAHGLEEQARNAEDAVIVMCADREDGFAHGADG
jgi:hypothetical protein